MRITLLSDPGLVNSNYRSYQPMQVLSRGGHDVTFNRAGEPISAEMLLGAEVVHIHRLATPELQVLVRHAKAAGVGIVWDNDDDVTAVPKSNPLYARFGGAKSRGMLAGVKAMVALADVVTTPSESLAAQYRELGGADVRVLENYLPREFAGVRPIKHDGLAIACLAGLEHQVDYQQLGIREALLRLLEDRPDLRVMSIGLGLGLPPDRYEHLKLVGFLDLARTLARCDVGIAPLVDIAWNRARSNVKLKEYASAGLPWLASPVGSYRGMGEQQGGRLVPDDGWHGALEQLLASARERRKLAKRAARWVKDEGIAQHAHRWEAAMRDAVERAQGRRAAAAG